MLQNSVQPVHVAIYDVRDDALLMLIAWGATCNERDKDGSIFKVVVFLNFKCVCFMTEIYAQNTNSWTPLYFASRNKHARMCRMLCALDDIDVNAGWARYGRCTHNDRYRTSANRLPSARSSQPPLVAGRPLPPSTGAPNTITGGQPGRSHTRR